MNTQKAKRTKKQKRIKNKSRLFENTIGTLGVAFAPDPPPFAVLYLHTSTRFAMLGGVRLLSPLCVGPSEWNHSIESLKRRLERGRKAGLRYFKAAFRAPRRGKKR